MKIKFILINILLSTVLLSQTQKFDSISVTYEVTKSIAKYTFNTQLVIKDSISQYSYFTDNVSLIKDEMTVSLPFQKYINQYNLATNKMHEVRTMKNDKQLMAEWTPNYNWEITNEESEINGYKVIKATANSIEIDPNDRYYYGKVIAWYTPEINISSGPARYVGLPGLILKIEYEKDKSIKYIVKEIDFKPKTIKLENVEGNNNAIKVDDPNDVIYFFHKNNKAIKKLLR